MKLVLNYRLKHPRLVVSDNGDVFLEVNPKDKDNKKLHKQIKEKNKDWLEKKVQEKEKNRPFPIVKNYEMIDGTGIQIMGRSYKLRLIPKGDTKIDGKYFQVEAVRTKHKIRKYLVSKYGEYVLNKVKEYQVFLGIKKVEIHYKEFPKKFGLAKTGSITLNWKILMLDSSLIDYIILHELAHLKEMNHGVNFWGLVAKIMPDFQERDNQLRIHREIVLNF